MIGNQTIQQLNNKEKTKYNEYLQELTQLKDYEIEEQEDDMKEQSARGIHTQQEYRTWRMTADEVIRRINIKQVMVHIPEPTPAPRPTPIKSNSTPGNIYKELQLDDVEVPDMTTEEEMEQDFDLLKQNIDPETGEVLTNEQVCEKYEEYSRKYGIVHNETSQPWNNEEKEEYDQTQYNIADGIVDPLTEEQNDDENKSIISKEESVTDAANKAVWPTQARQIFMQAATEHTRALQNKDGDTIMQETKPPLLDTQKKVMEIKKPIPTTMAAPAQTQKPKQKRQNKKTVIKVNNQEHPVINHQDHGNDKGAGQRIIRGENNQIVTIEVHYADEHKTYENPTSSKCLDYKSKII
ncbi:hypothetical protein WOLCODRAFT_18874 [Wolfiporia cocos MD-104 SS10]|uniref:Uncharacterized protein n=1 Tax=Wolfiporia cocos (strain MD-104) TaxID=742152 RepID=A0A2H3K7E0_WOLCO|nr:hypothetical protein WOLCODRAFT_18874 [Wolfiporia cocos MD-104 SS10]